MLLSPFQVVRTVPLLAPPLPLGVDACDVLLSSLSSSAHHATAGTPFAPRRGCVRRVAFLPEKYKMMDCDISENNWVQGEVSSSSSFFNIMYVFSSQVCSSVHIQRYWNSCSKFSKQPTLIY